jgi:hypothetical protein
MFIKVPNIKAELKKTVSLKYWFISISITFILKVINTNSINSVNKAPGISVVSKSKKEIFSIVYLFDLTVFIINTTK